MSDATHPHADDGPHEGPIKTPKQLILAVFFAFVVPIIAIILLVIYVAADKKPAAGSDAMGAQATAERIRPVGMVEVKDASDPAALKSGEQVYTTVCAACHAAGTLNAPKLGDNAAWAPRLAQGFNVLLTSAVKGKGAMPAQGGGDHTELEISRAVVYMANKAGAKFEEPKAPAPAAAAAAAATPPAAAPVAAAAAPAPAPVSTAAAPQADAAPPLYAQNCAACHAAGVAGAPKLGDKAAWAPRLALGIDGLTTSVIKGKGAMPPKGGSSASDADIKAVVTYMANQAK
ncbi:Cytochrome c-555 [Burkholderiaceae bacterium]|nr:Cytochrome c-555 [Burkholderiaceae bacterium]